MRQHIKLLDEPFYFLVYAYLLAYRAYSFFRIEYMQSIALSGMIVVIMSILFSLTLLPAVLSLMGKRLKQLGQKAKNRLHFGVPLLIL
ncbi:hypothetical protein GCM10020331_073060 [Ectobacillus funiculus]